MASLLTYVSNLRRVLEPHRPPRAPATVLRTQALGYVLDSHRAEVDVRWFDELATAGHEALAGGDALQAVRVFDAALGLWRGPPYAEVRDAAWLASMLSLVRARACLLPGQAGWVSWWRAVLASGLHRHLWGVWLVSKVQSYEAPGWIFVAFATVEGVVGDEPAGATYLLDGRTAGTISVAGAGVFLDGDPADRGVPVFVNSAAGDQVLDLVPEWDHVEGGHC